MRTRDGPNTTRTTLTEFNTYPCRSNVVNGFQEVSTCLNVRMRTHTDDAASAIVQPRTCNDSRLGYLAMCDVRLKWSMWVESLYVRVSLRLPFRELHFTTKLRRLPLFRAYTIHCPNFLRVCFLMSSKRFDKFVSSDRFDKLVSYIPYLTAFVLVVLYSVFVLPHIQDYIVAASGYITAAQKAAHAQEFPRGCSPVTRYNRPVFEIYGLY